MTALNVKLKFSQGSVVFVKLIHDWYKMMSIKSKHAGTRFNDDLRKSWTRDCDTYQKLLSPCIVIATCKWEVHRGSQKKLTKFTTDAFINTTKANIAAAIRLQDEYNFKYVLPALWSQNFIENFFGQAMQRMGGNFYIDICDVMSAGKVLNLH